MLYSGIDLHKRTCVITTVDAAGETVGQATLPTNREAVASYFARLPSPHHATVEATGTWYWISDLLAAHGVNLTLAHAKFLKAIAYAKVKTDAVDSHTLAQLLRAQLIPEAHMIAPELRPLRDVMRARLRLVQKQISARNSLSRIQEKYNVSRLEELPEFAQLQAACSQEQIDLLQNQIRCLERSLHPRLLPDDDVQRLLWVPGIGKISAFTLVLEIGNIERFPSVGNFWSYCRLVPGAGNSAGKTRHTHSKDGNRYLKIVFSHAAVRAAQYYPEIRGFYQRTTRKKNKPIARTLVGKELARIVYHILKQRVDFNHRFKGIELQRRKTAEWPRRASPTV